MPRLKVCRTKALIREANRIKSARHYHKHRESILASKKAAREKLRQEEEIERQVPDILLKTRTKRTFRIKANKKRRQERFQTDQAEMGRLATDYFDPASRLQRLKNGLMQVTGSCPSGYIENLFNLYMQLRESGTKRKNTPLSDAQVMFDTMLSSIYRFTQEILNMNGLNADFKRAEAFAGQVRTLIRCLDDFEW
ncbi:hypothetical protein MPER_06918, partial [Moniliophthora perniciosa FA553]